ncbi:MAG TPA: hypothetical protein VGS12_17695 [Caulobacteraceae bacterium]|nr:hypothetical protein [Caulobacteraceae bacterium]
MARRAKRPAKIQAAAIGAAELEDAAEGFAHLRSDGPDKMPGRVRIAKMQEEHESRRAADEESAQPGEDSDERGPVTAKATAEEIVSAAAKAHGRPRPKVAALRADVGPFEPRRMTAAALARLIVKAGAGARGEKPPPVEPPFRLEYLGLQPDRHGPRAGPSPTQRSALAQAIIAAGRKARGENPDGSLPKSVERRRLGLPA